MALPHQPDAPALVVLAAGIGHRFGSPKQLAPVGPKGEAIVDYTARDGRAAGFGSIVLVVRAEVHKKLAEHIETSWPPDVAADVRYSAQDAETWSVAAAKAGRTKPLGTAHAVVAAAIDAQLDRPFAVVNADDLYGAEAFALLHAGLATTGLATDQPADGLLVPYQVANTLLGPGSLSRALCDVDEHGGLRGVREGTIDSDDQGLTWTSASGADRRMLAGRELVSMNCWGFGIRTLELLRGAVDRFVRDPVKLAGPAEILLPDVVAHLIATDGITFDVRPSTGWCLGLTHAEDLELLRARLDEPAW